MLDVTFYGVRGSTPCSCDVTQRIGGNTSCVLVRGPEGDEPIVLDLGTGLRYLGNEWCASLPPGDDGQGRFGGTALVTHLHWDHIQGIPFFVPMLKPESRLRLVGPPQPGSTLAAEIHSFIRPPLFPVHLSHLPGEIEFVEMDSGTMMVGSSTVSVMSIDHPGPTNGYRIDNGEGSVVYMPDHQEPADGSLTVSEAVVDFCADVDLLIHDAQYDADEFAARSDWGHSTVRFAAEVARRSGARRLALFHHDPAHDDAWIERAVERGQRCAGRNVEVFAASEGLAVTSGRATSA